MRLTPSGFNKLERWIEATINTNLQGGFCINQGNFTSGPGGSYCSRHTQGCTGCRVFMSINPGTFQATAMNDQTMKVSASLKIDISEIRLILEGIAPNCEALRVSGDAVHIAGNVALTVSPTDGTTNLKVLDVNELDLGAINLSNCGVVGEILDWYKDTFAPDLRQAALERMTPSLREAFAEFVPYPFGVEGSGDISNLIGTSTGPALLETRLVVGGYADVARGGMSLGLITGINSDAVPETRDESVRPDDIPYASEPNRCVPPILPANFNAPPYLLSPVDRSGIANGPVFSLAPAGEFVGSPEVPGDFSLGISESTLNLLGHHLVASGALCMSLGTQTFSNLDLGDFNVVIPSIGTLQSKGQDPVLLVGRPQRAITFRIGDNTKDSPAITAEVSHLEVDLYGFLYERYVRLLTMDLSADIGINLEVASGDGGATIRPVLVGVTGDSITAEVINSDFVKEKPRDLESVLPSLFEVVVQRIGAFEPIKVPAFAGFTLADLSLHHVSTDQDNFLAINATLGASAAARQLAVTNSFMAQAVTALDAELRTPRLTSAGRANLVDVATPSAPKIRDALARVAGGALPSVTFDVDRFDSVGGQPRELEWSWNLNGGMWHEFQSGSPLVISDRAFAFQGKYTIGLRSRVKGDYTTTSNAIETPVVIDSVGPKIFADEAAWRNGNMVVSVRDTVSGTNVQVAFASPGADAPETEWRPEADASLPRAVFDRLAVGGDVAVYARDELGNQTVELVTPLRDSSQSSGCGCQSTGRAGAGAFALFGIVGALLLRRRRPNGAVPRLRRYVTTVTLWLGVSVAASLQPGCSCENPTYCEVAAQCTGCDDQLAFCVDNQCICSDTVPLGHVGPYSDVAVGADGSIWVSAYAQSHGDLVVAKVTDGRVPDDAWEWIDGVPDGPVVVSDSKIRNGVGDDGPDTGMYTSIAVSTTGVPMISYFDVERGTLRFATRVDGTWKLSDVDVGTGKVDEPGGSVVGMYSSLTIRSDDGRPGVAYLAHVHDAGGIHAEVRYAAAQTILPTGPGDWQTWRVDTGAVPATDPETPGLYPLPEGLGLFIDSARNPTNQAPAIAYYDRSAGHLKVAKFNPTTSQFEKPLVLDGSPAVDAGWYPSLQVDQDGKVHVAYVSTTTNSLKYVVEGSAPEVIDDGYRIVGTSVDGLPKPELHFVGTDVNLLVIPERHTRVIYQDATTQELLLAQRYTRHWESEVIAGGLANNKKWPGAYGFFASAAATAADLIISTWVINQPIAENWVEIFIQPLYD